MRVFHFQISGRHIPIVQYYRAIYEEYTAERRQQLAEKGIQMVLYDDVNKFVRDTRTFRRDDSTYQYVRVREDNFFTLFNFSIPLFVFYMGRNWFYYCQFYLCIPT